MLGRGDLVVLSRRSDAHLPELLVQILHERADALPDDAEILIVQLLPLGRGRAEQGAAGIDEVAALEILFTVYNKILLLRSYRRNYSLCSGISEKTEDTQCLLVYCLHRTKKRCLLIQCLALIGAEGSRNAKGNTNSIFF